MSGKKLVKSHRKALSLLLLLLAVAMILPTTTGCGGPDLSTREGRLEHEGFSLNARGMPIAWKDHITSRVMSFDEYEAIRDIAEARGGKAGAIGKMHPLTGQPISVQDIEVALRMDQAYRRAK